MNTSPNLPRYLAYVARLAAFAVAAACFASVASADFGLTSDANFYTVDTDAGLVFKVRRLDNGVSTQSAGDIASLKYKGVEYQDLTRGTQVNSGFDYLYTGISSVTVNGEQIGTDFVKITVTGGDLTHYYLARRGYPHIYMATYFTTEPSTLGLCRFIVRIPSTLLPNGPTPSDIRNNTGAIESGDIFGMADGTTRSKHYSNMRLRDWRYIGATGNNVGIFIVRDNNEGGSGGPFYRCLLNQGASDQELTYIVNYGEIQTEAFRTSILNSYTLVCTDGAPPATDLDTSWFGNMNLLGYVAPSGRGTAWSYGTLGVDTQYRYTVGFANATAQYWTDFIPSAGAFFCSGMLPGTYTMTLYKNELAVATRSVTVAAGASTFLDGFIITGDPSATTPLWRIGDWDGTPLELLNGDKVTTMHPQDVRMSPWVQPDYLVGTSTPSANFPAYSWKAVNNPITIRFQLTAEQIAAYSVRAGITVGYAGGRPQIKVNNYNGPIPAAPNEPKTRSLTVGSYRGNNVLYSVNIPASALVVGENVLTLTVVSGSSGSGFLSPGCAYDCVDMILQAPTLANAAASGEVNRPFTYQLSATNLPTSYDASGLPAGLSLDKKTGLISGTPGSAGSFSIGISATNSTGTATATLTLTIQSPSA